MEGAFLKEFEDYLVAQNLTEMKRAEIIEQFGTPTGRYSKSTITSGLARGGQGEKSVQTQNWGPWISWK